MSDPNSAGDGQHTPPPPPPPPANGPQMMPPRPPFPAARLLYSILYGIIAWFVLWITFLLVLVQFIVIAVNARANEELRNITASLAEYLWELLAYMAFARDEQPFPFGPFPKTQAHRA